MIFVLQHAIWELLHEGEKVTRRATLSQATDKVHRVGNCFAFEQVLIMYRCCLKPLTSDDYRCSADLRRWNEYWFAFDADLCKPCVGGCPVWLRSRLIRRLKRLQKRVHHYLR